MQPKKYTIYLRNLAQTVSRNLAGVDEVITGLDTTWAGGPDAMSNYLNQRYTIPRVRKELCQGLASKLDSSSLIEKAIVKVTYSAFMRKSDNESSGPQNLQEFSCTLPGSGFGKNKGPRKTEKQIDRVVIIEEALREAQEQQLRSNKKSKKYGKITRKKPEEQE